MSNLIRIGDVCEIINGYAFKSGKYVGEGIRVIRITNVQKGIIEDADPQYYPVSEQNEIEKYMLQEGDLLMSLTGNVGRVALLGGDMLPAALNQRVACLRIKDSTIIYKPFLFHLLNSDYFESECIFSSKGIAQKNMSTEWLKEYSISLPPMEQQINIAEKFEKTSKLIALRKEQLAKLDQLVKSRFIEMFVTTNDVKYWAQTTIADVSTDMRTGPFGSALHHDEFVDSGVFVLGIDNAVENKFSYNRMRYITEEKYRQLKRYTVYPGDVIITIMGTVGRSAVIPKDMPKAINTKHLACITPNTALIDSTFLSSAFQMHPSIRLQLQNQCKGAIMDGLNLTIIKALRFALPPMDLQQQFASFVEQVDKSKLTIQTSLDKLELLKKSLMQKYFG